MSPCLHSDKAAYSTDSVLSFRTARLGWVSRRVHGGERLAESCVLPPVGGLWLEVPARADSFQDSFQLARLSQRGIPREL